MSNTVKALLAIIIVAVVAGGALFFMRDDGTGSSSTTESESTSDAESDADRPAMVLVTYTTSGFTSPTVWLRSGDTLDISNQSGSTIEPSSDNHPDHQLNTELNFGAIEPGQSGSMLVTKTGTWGIHDHRAAARVMTVIVE